MFHKLSYICFILILGLVIITKSEYNMIWSEEFNEILTNSGQWVTSKGDINKNCISRLNY
jgi:hypothetical protein